MRRLKACTTWAGIAAVAFLGFYPVRSQDSLENREVTVTSGPYALRLPATFHADSRLVEAPVVVRNFKGEAVGGLKREDFEIRDQGKKRDISSFAVEVADSPGRLADMTEARRRRTPRLQRRFRRGRDGWGCCSTT